MKPSGEAAFQAQVIELARTFNWLAYHTFDSRRCTPGFPDICLVRGERVCWIELKTDKGQLRPEQKVWLAALVKAGQEVMLVRPSQWDRLVEVLSPKVTCMVPSPDYVRWYD